MNFIGQTHIINQLQDLLPYLYETGDGLSLLFRGPSGYGKTRLALLVCNYLSGGDFSHCEGDNFVFRENYYIHFIDEVHNLPQPEILYPIIDSGKYVIVLATNDAALLPEALVNRCIEFIFTDYSVPELRLISNGYLTIKLPDEFLDYIIESGGGNPRVIKNLIFRLNILFLRRPGIIKDLDLNKFKLLLQESFGIVDGMDALCARYITALKVLGGTASLQTISTYLHVDQNSLRYYAEPVLLYKNLIRISSKGRSLHDS